jgi:catechol 2,3-dioxygenase-like lactoylglutathione lyase family enzyme
MLEGIQHIGYLVADLDAAVAWFAKAFGAVNAGGGAMADSRIVPGGGKNAFVRFGTAEVELMQPTDTSRLPAGTLVMHHVGYVVGDMDAAVAHARAKGIRFLADAPYTNHVGQRVLYFDPDTTNGAWFHLTGVPATEATAGPGPRIDGVVHPGYLVRDLDAAVAWYVEKLGAIHVGGGPSRRGGRIAFVEIGKAQIELIEPEDTTALGPDHVLDHVGYLTRSLDADLAGYRARGLAFATEAPAVNPIGQRLIYLDTATSMGSRMHLTELPA